MMQIVIFGGTLEGRRLTEVMMHYNIEIHVCVATEYGGLLLPDRENVHVHMGRMNQEQIAEFLAEKRPLYCVDATHPYAMEVTKNICRACETLDITYLRLLRDEETVPADCGGEELPAGKTERAVPDIVYVESVDAAVEFLKGTDGNIFITTGSKELEKYTLLPDYENRCVARVLPTAEVMEKCAALRFMGKNLICMQGPFSENLNYEMYRRAGAAWLVTKSTGKAGGFEEKCEAAVRAGVRILVVGRPEEPVERTYTFQNVVDIIANHKPEPKDDAAQCNGQEKMIYLVGMGPGDAALLTREAGEIIAACDVLIGAGRVLEISSLLERKPHFVSYKPQEIKAFIDSHPEYDRIAVLYSGDVGFYSGASGFTDAENGTLYVSGGGIKYRICKITGISAPVYFMNRLGKTWEDAVLVSNHGKQTALVPLIRDNHKVCSLLGDKTMVSDICRRLTEYGMDEVSVTVGERLSYADERISTGKPSELAGKEFDKLAVILFENPKPGNKSAVPGICDEEFIRGKAPMTKREVRVISLSELSLARDSVLYDIGAGTGSVSVEAALLADRGTVYAVEQKTDAVALLQKNKRKFAADNIEIILGSAPEALEKLPVPTHAFIGGSSGHLIEIIEEVRRKNMKTRFVVNAVTVETLAVLLKVVERYPEYADMTIIQAGISRSRGLGRYHMMMAENPVYIAAFGGKTELQDESVIE